TILTARVRRRDEKSDADAIPLQNAVSGSGVKSDAGVTGETVRGSAPAPTESQDVTAITQASARNVVPRDLPKPDQIPGGMLLTRRPVGSLLMTLRNRGGGSVSPRMTVLFEDTDGNGVLVGTTDDVQIHETKNAQLDETNVEMINAQLQTVGTPQQRFCAERLRLINERGAAGKPHLRMELESADVQFESAGHESKLMAERIELQLSLAPFGVDQVQADGLGSRKTDALAVSNSDDSPEEGSWVDLKKRRGQQQTKRAINTSQALPAPYALGIEGALNRKTNASFQEVSLADAVKELARQQGVNIVLDKRGLEEEGVSLNEKLSIEVSGISLRSVLKLILDPLNLGTRIGEDDVIIVTSRQRVAGELDVRVYPVAALVVPISDRVSIHTDAESGAAATPVTSPAPQLDFEKLIELITSTVDPDSWRQVGGSGSIVANKTTLSLVTRQTPVVHAEIADLLDQLRRLQDLQVTLEMQTLEVPQSFLTSWDIGREFRSLGQSKTQRYMRLTREQAEQLRQGSKAESFPRVTLFNGQVCQWKLGGSDSGQSMLELQPVVSNDRRFVRLGVNQNDAETNGTGADSFAVISPVSNGDAVLLELDALASSGAPFVGVPIPGQPKAFRAAPKPGRFFLIQPQFVIVEEEEELLGSDAGR
ncbi:MAG: hypothetical protein ISQ06_06065, partial [Planctomycetaceae bacterium]|nr:hypothetical protein [Planctomycetaceae bacterium]